MKRRILYLSILVITGLSSCNNNWSNLIPKSAYDAPFPKENRDASQLLGDKLYIKRGNDTTILTITNIGKRNLIVDKNGDTIFYGSVSRFRGLYYFSQQLNDTSYLIYTVRKSGNYLYGLNAPWYEGVLIDHSVKRGEYKKLVKSISKDGNTIRLHPDKKEMRKLYAMVMDSLPPDTLLMAPVKKNLIVKTDTASITKEIDTDDFEMFSKVYPNPATENLNIALQQKMTVGYTLSDITGKAITNGELHDSINQVNIGALQSGVYILTLVKANGKGEESVKVIKR